ncbi:MAG: hypothetical protein AAF333_18830 [Planctomycetota bacterium]
MASFSLVGLLVVGLIGFVVLCLFLALIWWFINQVTGRSDRE